MSSLSQELDISYSTTYRSYARDILSIASGDSDASRILLPTRAETTERLYALADGMAGTPFSPLMIKALGGEGLEDGHLYYYVAETGHRDLQNFGSIIRRVSFGVSCECGGGLIVCFIVHQR